MIRNTLVKLGLSEQQVKIYLTCYNLWSLPASIIAKKCGQNRTSTYSTLDILIKKGLLKTIIVNKIKYYSAVDLEIIIEKFDNKIQEIEQWKKDFSQLLNSLNTQQSDCGKIKVQFYHWIKWIQYLYDELLTMNSEVIWIENVNSIFDLLWEFVNDFIKKRIEKKIHYRIICPKSNISNIDSPKEYRTVRYFDQIKFPFSCDINLCKNRLSIISLDKNKPIWVTIINEDIANNFRSMFEMCWDYLSLNQK